MLEPADAGKLACELGGPLRAGVGALPQRLLETGGDGDGREQRLVQTLDAADEPAQQRWISRTRGPEVSDLRVRGLGSFRTLGRGDGLALGRLRLRTQLSDFGFELASSGLELEQHRLGGLAGEPELAALRIEAEPLLGHGRNGRPEERVERHDRQLGDTLGGPLADEHGETSETGVAGALEQRQAGGRIVGHHRRGAPGESGRDGALAAGLDVEQRQCERRTLVGERTGGRRNPFTLGQRALERAEPLLCDGRTLVEVVARVCGGASGCGRLVGGELELGGCRAGALCSCLCLGQLDAEPLAEPRHRLGAHRDPLPRRPEPVQRTCCALAATRRVGELGLESLALAAEGIQALFGPARGAPLEGRQAFVRGAGALCSCSARCGCGTRGRCRLGRGPFERGQ